MSTDEQIAAYNAERDAVLASDDLGRFIAFSEKNLQQPFSSREVAEIAMHKMRTAVPAVPRMLRVTSYRWLTERGMKTWDDGDLAAT